MIDNIKPFKSSNPLINILYLLFVLTLPITTLSAFTFYFVSFFLFCLTCIFFFLYIMISFSVIYFFSEINYFLPIIPLTFFAFFTYYFLNNFSPIIRIIFRRIVNIKISVIIYEYKYGILKRKL